MGFFQCSSRLNWFIFFVVHFFKKSGFLLCGPTTKNTYFWCVFPIRCRDFFPLPTVRCRVDKMGKFSVYRIRVCILENWRKIWTPPELLWTLRISMKYKMMVTQLTNEHLGASKRPTPGHFNQTHIINILYTHIINILYTHIINILYTHIINILYTHIINILYTHIINIWV